MTDPTATIPTPGMGCISRTLGAGFFALFLAAGIFFVAVIVREFYQGSQSRWWARTPCTIVQSRVERQENADDNPYRPIIHFRYTVAAGAVAGEARTSTAWRLKNRAFDSFYDAQRIVDRHPAGSAGTCFVDPDDPSRAVLEHGSPWILAVIPLPLLFVIIGGGGVFAMFWNAPAKTTKPRPLSNAPAAAKKFAPVTLFGIFFVVGTLMFVFLFLIPFVRLIRAQSWPAVPCTIVSCEIIDVSDSESSSYKPDVLYRYTIDGREHLSNRLRITPFNNSSSAKARQIIDRYRRGSKATCYVDPSDSHIAVLERDFTWAWAFGVIPLAFILVGGGGVWSTMNKRAEPGVATTLITRRTPTASRTRAGMPLTLRPRQSPWVKLAGLLS